MPAKTKKTKADPEEAKDSIKFTVSEVDEAGQSEETVVEETTLSVEAETAVEAPLVEETKSEESGIDTIFSNTQSNEIDVQGKDEEKEETVLETSETEKPKQKKSTLKIIFTFFGGFTLGSLIMAAVFYFVISPSGLGTKTETAPTPFLAEEVSLEPTQSPKPIDLSQYKVQVLNGSGVKGAAAKVKGLIESLEFESIATGNAPTSGFTKTEVSLKEAVSKEVIGKIKESLPDFDVTEGEALRESSDYDIIVTVGKEK